MLAELSDYLFRYFTALSNLEYMQMSFPGHETISSDGFLVSISMESFVRYPGIVR
jgi:hypothetical protein